MSGSVWQPRPLQNAQAGLKGNTSLKIPSSQNFWAEGTKLKLLFAKEVLTAKSPESAALLKSAMFINFLLLFLEYNRDNTVFLHSSFFVIDLQRSQRSPIWKDSWTLHVKKNLRVSGDQASTNEDSPSKIINSSWKTELLSDWKTN